MKRMKPEQLGTTFSKNLIAARRRAGLSQRALATKIGLSGANSIIEWEKGKASPTLTTVARLAKALEVPPEALLTEMGHEILSAVPA